MRGDERGSECASSFERLRVGSVAQRPHSDNRCNLLKQHKKKSYQADSCRVSALISKGLPKLGMLVRRLSGTLLAPWRRKV